MKGYLLDNGDLWIPMSIHQDGMVDDGMIRIGPEDPRYAEWKDHVLPLPENLKRFVPRVSTSGSDGAGDELDLPTGWPARPTMTREAVGRGQPFP